jgi:putative ABC transport system ATP-binding protein
MFLEIKDIYKSFGEKDSRVEVLKGVNLELEKGQFCVLLGPSGSGKSTLLNIIGGIDSADSGEIIVDGSSMNGMNDKSLTRYRREHLGYIFQMYNLIPNLTVRENIEVGAYLSKDHLDVDEIIDVLGLRDHAHKLPNQLSGGQQQRTSIGRAIVKNPDVLLCDEPTGALDYNTSKEILSLIDKVNRTYGNTIVMVTDNEAIADMGKHRVIKLIDCGIDGGVFFAVQLAVAEDVGRDIVSAEIVPSLQQHLRLDDRPLPQAVRIDLRLLADAVSIGLADGRRGAID